MKFSGIFKGSAKTAEKLCLPLCLLCQYQYKIVVTYMYNDLQATNTFQIWSTLAGYNSNQKRRNIMAE